VTRRLDDEDVGAADVLVDLAEDLAVREEVTTLPNRRQAQISRSSADGRGLRRPSFRRT
jgi:hypothetical protein